MVSYRTLWVGGPSDMSPTEAEDGLLFPRPPVTHQSLGAGPRT